MISPRSTGRFPRARFVAVWFAFGGLLLASWVFAPSSVSSSQLRTLIFFAAVLGIAALGQHLVVVVGGLDLSIGSNITLAAMMFASVSGNDAQSILGAGLAAVLVAASIGLLNGLAVVVLRITPLIATLAVGSLALGAAYQVTRGVPQQVSGRAHDLALERWFGGFISIGAVVWVVLVIGAALILRSTLIGRRLVAVGASPSSMHTMGVRVGAYQLAAYVAGAAAAGVAGALLGAISGLPGIATGVDYMILSIAAVVIGGTPLGGGVGSVVATAGGALFMTQVRNSSASLQASTATQLMIQGVLIVVAVALYGLGRHRRVRRTAEAVQDPEVTAGPSGPQPAPAASGGER